jgi:OPA family glycerol-3-phosphate transporter-like MFS transporter
MPSAAPAAGASSDRMLAPAQLRTLVVLWTTYGSFYFCRVNLSAARTTIQTNLAISAFEIGLVLGAVKLGYALGQLVNGQLTERFGPRRILAIGMLGSGAATLLMAVAPELARVPYVAGGAAWLESPVHLLARALGADFATSGVVTVLLVLAFANGWFQAGGWPPCVKVASLWFPLALRGRTMGVLGTSLTMGSAIALAASGELVDATGGWRIACVAPAILLFASAVHTSFRLKERPDGPDPAGAIGPVRVDAPTDPSSHPHRVEFSSPARHADHMPVREALRATITNPKIWVLALALFGLDAVRYGFIDWAPGHLAHAHQTGALSAAMKTAVLPLAGAVGAFTSGRLSDRFFGSRRAPVCALLLAGVGVLTLVYRGVVSVGVVPTVITLALAGFCLFGAQILLVGTAAQDFARRGATAAAAGFVDFVGHMGAFSGDVVTGWMLKRHGWAGAISWWASAALVAALLVATLWRARPADTVLSNS